MIYNQERKMQFIQERKEKATISNNIMNIFELSSATEESYGRDICEWTSNEIISFYKYYSTASVQSLVQLHNALTMYTNWCISNGMVSDNQNHYTEINSIMLCSCINFVALRKMMVSREELLSLLRELPNYSDMFILLGIFEGIPAKQGCMFNIKISNISGNKLTLPDKSVVTISDELKHIMHIAAEEDTHTSLPSKKKEFEYEYTDGDHVLRHIKRNSVRPNEVLVIGSRMRKCADYLDKPGLTIKALAESGRMWEISKIMKEKAVSLEDAVIKYRSEHEAIYGPMQNTVTYINTYGVLIKEIYVDKDVDN